MKIPRAFLGLPAAFVVVAFSVAGFAANATVAPPSNAVVSISMSGGAQPAPPPTAEAAATQSSAAVQWKDIKDCTFEMRDQFLAGLQHLEGVVNNQVDELLAKRAAMKPADSKILDRAMKEIEANRFFLMAMGEQLSSATPETWEQRKAKVALAWTKTRESFAKLSANITG